MGVGATRAARAEKANAKEGRRAARAEKPKGLTPMRGLQGGARPSGKQYVFCPFRPLSLLKYKKLKKSSSLWQENNRIICRIDLCTLYL